MTKQQIQVKIKNLKDEYEVLRTRRGEVEAKYSRPSEWMADPDFKAINRARVAIDDELKCLISAIDEIEDQEWADRQAKNYPEGQV